VQARARLLRLEQLPIELVQDHIVALAFFEPRHGRLEVPRGSQAICACPNICNLLHSKLVKPTPDNKVGPGQTHAGVVAM